MRKMKPKQMRLKTKEELTKLATLLVEKSNFDDIRGSNEFIESAVHWAKVHGLDINWQSIKGHERWLEVRCQEKQKEKKEVMKQQRTILKVETTTTIFWSDGSQEVWPKNEIEIATPKSIPLWTMFCQGEDGLMILKGTYKGKYIHEIDAIAGFTDAKLGWAKWCLKNDKDLTDDDRVVFNKIISRQI